MTYKPEEKEKARELSRQGMTHASISEQLGVSASAVSLWCRDIVIEKRAQAKLAKEALPPKEKHVKKGVPAEAPFEGYSYTTCEYPNGTKRIMLFKSRKAPSYSMSLARYRMCVHLGRILDHNEVVVHKKGNSDDLENLRLTIQIPKSDFGQATCKACPTIFTKRKPTQAYCSVPCARKGAGAARTEAFEPTPRPCADCGKPFINRDSRRLTCSMSCAAKQRHQSIRDNGKVPEYQKTCKECGKGFVSRSPKASICSDRCRNDARNALRKEETKANPKRKPSVKKKKPPVPKSIKEVVLHDCVCVMCDNVFKSRDQNSEVCLRKSCNEIIANADEEERAWQES